MHRCIELAKKAAGYVAPNPMVGAVLVYNNRIIGEGYHQQYGGPHAEVNCINSVQEKDRPFIEHSILYVSLEPCAHFGKTPPCTNLIIEKKIKLVVVGCRDPFVEVNGKGTEQLKNAGVQVEHGILEEACKNLNKRFFTFHTRHRPYVILKWAQSANDKIAGAAGSRLYISNEYTNRIVHKWRAEEASILVGTNTALFDDPELTNRYWQSPSPIRLVVDLELKLPATLKMFSDEAAYTIVFNTKTNSIDLSDSLREKTGVGFYQVTNDVNLVHQIIHALYQLKIQSVLVEGGAKLLNSFIEEGMWDEARIITNEHLQIEDGIVAPVLNGCKHVKDEQSFSDHIHYYVNPKSEI